MAQLLSELVFLLLVCNALSLPNGLGLTPPMGYSSWNDCASQITEARIKNVTQHLIDTGLAAKGYVHVNVDEGWLKGRDSAGAIMEDRVKFPSGMKALGDWIHAQEVPGKGKVMKYGLYTSRGTCQCSTQQYSAVGSHGFEQKDAQWMVDAGMDYLKEDSCCGSQDQHTAFGEYGTMRDALNKTGRAVYFSLCGWNAWYAPEGGQLGNSWRIAGDGQNWEALSNCINTNVPLSQYARPGQWNDPDLLIGTGVGSNDLATNPSGCFNPTSMPQTAHWYLTDKQSRAQFSLWAIMSAPLLISADVGQVSSYALETWGNEELIAVSQTFREGGPYQGTRLFGGDIAFNETSKIGSGVNVWGKLLPTGQVAIAFLSNENTATNVTCDAGCLQAAKLAGKYNVRDLWSHQNVGGVDAASGYSVEVEPHGAASVFLFTPDCWNTQRCCNQIFDTAACVSHGCKHSRYGCVPQ